jgi:hypothetical protein
MGRLASRMANTRLEGKRAIITGGASGFGAMTSETGGG